jgi:adenosylmethionine-8-amino-7-oxononanoate aminotransferase
MSVSHVFQRIPGTRLPRAVSGQGVFIEDETGQRYLDASGGAAVSCLGHGHPAVIQAVIRQQQKMAFAHTLFFTNDTQERLAARLAERFPEPGGHVYFVSGGSEANETAIKMARQFWLSQDKPEKHVVISRRQSYHGNTLGALSVTGHGKRRGPYEPLLHDWPRIAPCYSYRHQEAGESAEHYAQRCADELEEAIKRTGADQVSAFIAETVVGASLGAVAPAPGYFQRIREICDRHGVLLILDEVMAGCGRTGTWYAFEQDGVVPDLVTLAKGLGGGYQPLAAVLARSEIHSALEAYGAFTHGHTYVGHATACAAGLAVMDTVLDDGLLERIGPSGDHLRALLRERFTDHPNVGDVRGRGLFIGLELVRDRDTRAPLEAKLGLPPKLRKAAMAHGLICYPGGSTADGKDGVHVLLAPPYIISEPEMEMLVHRLGLAMDQVLADA